jgi:hypothetical protein
MLLRVPRRGQLNAIGVDVIAAEIDGNGAALAMVITASIDTTSQVMLFSFTHRDAPAPRVPAYPISVLIYNVRPSPRMCPAL